MSSKNRIAAPSSESEVIALIKGIFAIPELYNWIGPRSDVDDVDEFNAELVSCIRSAILCPIAEKTHMFEINQWEVRDEKEGRVCFVQFNSANVIHAIMISEIKIYLDQATVEIVMSYWEDTL